MSSACTTPAPPAGAGWSARPATTHVRALVTWLAVFPVITGVSIVFERLTPHLPLILRTLVLTVIVVPAAVYILIPALMSARTRIMQRQKDVRCPRVAGTTSRARPVSKRG